MENLSNPDIVDALIDNVSEPLITRLGVVFDKYHFNTEKRIEIITHLIPLDDETQALYIKCLSETYMVLDVFGKGNIMENLSNPDIVDALIDNVSEPLITRLGVVFNDLGYKTEKRVEIITHLITLDDEEQVTYIDSLCVEEYDHKKMLTKRTVTHPNKVVVADYVNGRRSKKTTTHGDGSVVVYETRPNQLVKITEVDRNLVVRVIDIEKGLVQTKTKIQPNGAKYISTYDYIDSTLSKKTNVHNNGSTSVYDYVDGLLVKSTRTRSNGHKHIKEYLYDGRTCVSRKNTYDDGSVVEYNNSDHNAEKKQKILDCLAEITGD